MRKLILAMTAVAAFGLAAPLATPAQAEDASVVIRTGEPNHARYRDHDRRRVVIIQRDRHDRGLHRGWYKHRAESTRLRLRTD